MKPELARITISLENPLLEAFDAYIEQRGYATRSEAVRDLIREKLIQQGQATGTTEQVGVVSMVYDHHARNLADRLMNKQHDHHQLTVASLHVHLGPHHCLEVSVLRGPGSQLQKLADSLISTKGVLHGEIRYTGTEASLTAMAGAHEHLPA